MTCTDRLGWFLVLAVVLCASTASAICCPITPPEWHLRAVGQTNFVVVDDGEISLIPNIVIRGDAPDFALLVPTPSVPTLQAIDSALWNEASAMTRSRARRSSAWDDGCGEDDRLVLAADSGDEGVDIIDRQKVGAFLATILRADGAQSLIEWLDANGYAYTTDDADAFASYVDRDWVFTAMRLDPDDPQNQVPLGGWDHTVDPVVLTYAADEFEVALPITAINRETIFPMRFYVVSDERTTLEGFRTNYANRLSASELEAVVDAYPNVAGWLGAGRTLVRLDRTFLASDAMDASIFLRRASSQDDVVPTGGGGAFGGVIPVWLAPLVVLMGLRRLRRRRRIH